MSSAARCIYSVLTKWGAKDRLWVLFARRLAALAGDAFTLVVVTSLRSELMVEGGTLMKEPARQERTKISMNLFEEDLRAVEQIASLRHSTKTEAIRGAIATEKL